MKTIVLPGLSPHNKDWAYEVKENLGKDILVHEWGHWETDGNMNIGNELTELRKEIGKEKVGIIAKSVGTLVCAKLLEEIPDKIIKIILCGIPSTSDTRKEIYSRVFANFSAENMLVFQNINDPLASYEEVVVFMEEVNSKIKVIRKPGSDHHYPYFEDFKSFLSS